MNVPILYLGPEGTHSHEAALRRFGPKAKLVPCLSHHEIFSRLCAARARPRPLAIVPVENSSEGPVTQTLDQLADHPAVGILDSFSLPVRQHLMAATGTRLADVRRIYSHPQALGQCRGTLARRVPRAVLVPESSTAAAAERVAREPAAAAVASAAAATLHGLAILRKNVQDGEAVDLGGGIGRDGGGLRVLGGAAGGGGGAGIGNQFRARQQAGQRGAALAEHLRVAADAADAGQLRSGRRHEMLRHGQGKAVQDAHAGTPGQLVQRLRDGSFAGVFHGHDGQRARRRARGAEAREDLVVRQARHELRLRAEAPEGGLVRVRAFGAQIQDGSGHGRTFGG